jgi:hypothetical protein
MAERESFDIDAIDAAYNLLSKATKSKPVKSRELDGLFDTPDADGHPRCRALVLDVIRKKKLPLIGDNNGYYPPQTWDEVQKYAENIDNRIQSMMNRKALIQTLFALKHPDKVPKDNEYPDDEL